MSDFNPATFVISSLVNELFVDGNKSQLINLIKNGFESEADNKDVIDLVPNIIKYFELSETPTDEFLDFIGCEKAIGIEPLEDRLKIFLFMDSQNMPFLIDTPIDNEGVLLLNSAIALHGLGLKNNADQITRIAMKIIFETVFSDEIYLSNFKKLAKKAISDAQRIRAKKPRSVYYSEVMDVISLTWARYPAAPKTALLDALSAHYYRKVSRNALDNWISMSGLRPPKPEKYSDFELVFPQQPANG